MNLALASCRYAQRRARAKRFARRMAFGAVAHCVESWADYTRFMVARRRNADPAVRAAAAVTVQRSFRQRAGRKILKVMRIRREAARCIQRMVRARMAKDVLRRAKQFQADIERRAVESLRRIKNRVAHAAFDTWAGVAAQRAGAKRLLSAHFVGLERSSLERWYNWTQDRIAYK